MKKSSFLTVSMSPTLQKTLVFSALVPDTVNRTGEYRLDVAGKGLNVCRVLTQLGKEACHLTQLGGALRPLYLELCAEDKLKLEWVESNSPIRLCYTLVDLGQTQAGGKKTVTELVEEPERVGEGTEQRLLEKFSLLLHEHSSLIISGTKAAGFSDALIPEMVGQAKAEKRRLILDIRGNDLLSSLPLRPEIIKPNLVEFISTFAPEMFFQNNVANIDNVEEKVVKEKVKKICAELYDEYRCALVLTRGSDSVWYAEKGELAEYAFEGFEPLNSIGSGDAFTAGLAAALEEGASLRKAVAEGARCGALNAALLKPGVIC